MRTSNFPFQDFNGFPGDFGKNKELVMDEPTVNSLMVQTPGETLIGLKLAKRSRSGSQTANAPCCQVEGCNLDLSSAKEYHRRHRVCESHTKCPTVIVGGRELRFCQQCSRFHSLAEFDGKKRSCRRRLFDHNARRRKRQPEANQFNSAKLSSSVYDVRQQVGLLVNRFPLVRTRTAANPTWDSTPRSKFMEAKGILLKPAKAAVIDEQLCFNGNELRNTVTMLSGDAVVLNQDLEDSMSSPNLDAAQDVHHAFSLLSTDSWSSCEPQPASLAHYSVVPQGLPVTSSGRWQSQEETTDFGGPLTYNGNGCGGHYQEFQLLKAPNESTFISNHQLTTRKPSAPLPTMTRFMGK
ncbi:squamosa promoter-binding-like protein 12 isoform X2 [Malania oleifera]|uniref:squamosa promoter-binding-like protein 12 isoform X2 n=1 Tax=Malania oleifera TaxID=397392 RepID=UPI0025AE9498|nr:squamosa promoter-binding-like protein 12 isoform X2 [Malania oleifera]